MKLISKTRQLCLFLSLFTTCLHAQNQELRTQTTIFFERAPANAFKGVPPNESVTVTIKENYRLSTMIADNLTTTSTDTRNWRYDLYRSNMERTVTPTSKKY